MGWVSNPDHLSLMQSYLVSGISTQARHEGQQYQYHLTVLAHVRK